MKCELYCAFDVITSYKQITRKRDTVKTLCIRQKKTWIEGAEQIFSSFLSTVNHVELAYGWWMRIKQVRPDFTCWLLNSEHFSDTCMCECVCVCVFVWMYESIHECATSKKKNGKIVSLCLEKKCKKEEEAKPRKEERMWITLKTIYGSKLVHGFSSGQGNKKKRNYELKFCFKDWKWMKR